MRVSYQDFCKKIFDLVFLSEAKISYFFSDARVGKFGTREVNQSIDLNLTEMIIS